MQSKLNKGDDIELSLSFFWCSRG